MDEEKKELEFGTSENIIEALSALKNRINSAISYMNVKGKKGNLKNHIFDLNEIQFWSSSVIRQYIIFIEENFTP